MHASRRRSWRIALRRGNIASVDANARRPRGGEEAVDESRGNQGPLTGIRVIDLSAVVSGPFGTSILADQGADVITIEQSRMPDIIRFAGPLAPSAEGVSAFWASMNRNKRAVALDLKHPEGKQVLVQLAAAADVV